MKSSVRAQTQASLVDYTTRPRPEWVRKWPAMAVLAVSAICWSQVKQTPALDILNWLKSPTLLDILRHFGLS